MKFIKRQPLGPLFFGAGGDPLTRARNTGAKVGEWVREVVGIEDIRISPNHAWRHRFKTQCREVKMDKEVRDTIQGHEDGTAAASYGDVTVKAMWQALEAFPSMDLRGQSEEARKAEPS